jgi:predicted enzyme related to lactoylglutathione lyase
VEGVGGGVGVGVGPEAIRPRDVLRVADVGAPLEKAESLGGTRMMGPDEVPGVGIEIGLFSDPEGHVIGLTSPQAS